MFSMCATKWNLYLPEVSWQYSSKQSPVSMTLLLTIIFIISSTACAIRTSEQDDQNQTSISKTVFDSIFISRSNSILHEDQFLELKKVTATKDAAKKGLMYMFEKPFDPLYVPRANATIVYNLPIEDVPKNFISTRIGIIGALTVDVAKVTTAEHLPTSVRSIRRGEPFSIFLSSHRKAARDLIDLFMATEGVQGLKDFAANIRDKVNENLFVYSLSYVIIRKPEMEEVNLPAIFEIFPSKFIPALTLGEAEGNVTMNQVMGNISKPLVVDYDADFSGTDFNLEHRVAYWREDYGLNSHHWHWHLAYPLGMGVNRNRKGEMFYYMHSQMTARYDQERLSNGLPRVKALVNWREPMAEGYFPKLTVNNAGIAWGTRQDYTFMRDYARHDPVEPFTLNDLETWRERILDGIHKGYFLSRSGTRVPLTENVDILAGQKSGTDIIGDVFEADNQLSVNFPYYGDLHNFGHTIIAFSHDPDGSHKEQMGVMADSATAVRDPQFFRWHKFVDNIFQSYKLTQRPYLDTELLLINVTIANLGISSGSEGNIIRTFRDMKMIEASRGLDFGDTTPVFVNLTRLNHSPFTYHILVNNTRPADVRVTVRIFLAPKYNEAGKTMNFMEQRSLWAEMDKFDYLLQTGENYITRDSRNSSLTVPDELTFRELEKGDGVFEIPKAQCGCGWPQHMLVPRGKPEGMTFELFVILTDYELDKVEDETTVEKVCGRAHSLCGVFNTTYPDRRPMGFPFDRRPVPIVNTVQDLVNFFGNIHKLDIIIQYDSKLKV